MSWFGHTLLVVVQEVGHDRPGSVAELAARCAAVDPAVGSFVATRYTDETLPELYDTARCGEEEV